MLGRGRQFTVQLFSDHHIDLLFTLQPDGHSDTVNGICWDVGSNSLCSCSSDHHIDMLFTLQPNGHSVNGVCWDVGSNSLYSCSSDHHIDVLFTLQPDGHSDTINGICWDVGSSSLYSCSGDHHIDILFTFQPDGHSDTVNDICWDVHSNSCTAVLSDHHTLICCLHYSLMVTLIQSTVYAGTWTATHCTVVPVTTTSSTGRLLQQKLNSKSFLPYYVELFCSSVNKIPIELKLKNA